jgi:hypothetical protein
MFPCASRKEDIIGVKTRAKATIKTEISTKGDFFLLIPVTNITRSKTGAMNMGFNLTSDESPNTPPEIAAQIVLSF